MSSVGKVGKIALGTVQFGTEYGVANQTGKVPVDVVAQILGHARSSGVSTLDTAVAYGESQRVLGQNGVEGFSIITKLPEMPPQADIQAWVQAQLSSSLELLQVEHVDGLLLHRPEQLLQSSGQALYEALTSLKQQGLVKRIGVSVYGPQELDLLCESYHFDLVQAPFSVLDQRLKRSGWLQRLQQQGTALHVRSVFLQGLLLMTVTNRPTKFSRWNALWNEWEHWLSQTGQTALEACLRFAVNTPEIEKVVVGVDSLRHLEEILQAADGNTPVLPNTLLTDDSQLINPSMWSSL
jgi:aryl-alcohol dehydrogenase-like predicted oxidoreductase